MKKNIHAQMLWQINIATDDEGYMLGRPRCLGCGLLNVDPDDGHIIHPKEDEIIFDMLNNGFTAMV